MARSARMEGKMKSTNKVLLGVLAFGVAFSQSTRAEEDLQAKIDSLSKQVESLKEKSLNNWLTIGGDYRLRLDYLHGKSVAFTDVNATFANAQEQMNSGFFSGTIPGPQVAAFMAFASGMNQVTTYEGANAFLGANSALLSQFPGFAQQVGVYKPINNSLYTNRFGLDLRAKATQDVAVHARLLMYKTSGSLNDSAITNGGSAPFFADRVGVFDGTLGHIPSSDYLGVDRAYATWSNVADLPLWFSAGRRPSTNGIPENLRLNLERPGTGGVPAFLVDYAFDGMTLGWAPDIEALPGSFLKVCYGRGFDAGFGQAQGNSLKDTDFFGVSLVPVDTDPFRIHVQWNRGYNIFDFPVMNNTYFGNTAPSINLGSIDWFGTGVISTLKSVGPGTLHLFAELALSNTHPNNNVSANAGFQGLLTGSFFSPEAPDDKAGTAGWVGFRYDLPSNTKLGFEFNHGTRNWITFAPAADDLWTGKVGTRGNVYEAYIIQELNLKPVSTYLAKTFFKVGYQRYDFDYTGSNNWVGAPKKIADLSAGDMQLLTPLKSAQDVYGTFEVRF